ncbi:Leo1-like protein-domain-containing protein [Boeremia exigua]|uniref:Leo1-like protein-domain-containing protein n=1 Tax=Boeremia exigua TaxID=749465 RepID=UPI001E8E6B74|nr:Leo1-like protein-domain-containing protein [Boeremia exigua]KAH6615340.1 Leo1-like protein-domain-containing protein [Boeremia exigua]
MSDAGSDAAKGLSDNEAGAAVAPAESEIGGTPRDTVEENGLDDEDDLFGDGGSQRKLEDEELDSGDDEARDDRAPQAVEYEQEQQTLSFMETDLARHAVPEPTDGELYALKVPRFLAFEPTVFNHKTFQAPTTDHHSKFGASEHFSAYDTAMSTIRWRRSPSNQAELQSNARILRWSDGSLTLQFASNPTTQFDIDANTLAPPQINPRIPTPTSSKHGLKSDKESYTYLVAPYEEAQIMRVTNKFTTALSVVPAANLKDAALEKLQNDLAAAATRGRDEADQAISFVKVDEDPDLIRQREEATFKEKQRQLRAKEKHAERQAERANRGVGGHRGARSAGLSIDDLEDGDGAPRSKKPRPKSGLRRDWSDDEDYGRGPGRNREDDYDEEDDFIAASDEEPEIVEDDDDPDEGIAPSPKRRGGGHDDDDDAEVVPAHRIKRRRVVDDDEDDE